MHEHDETPAPTPSGHNWHLSINMASPRGRHPVALEWRQISDMVSVKIAGNVVADMPWDDFMNMLAWLTVGREKHIAESLHCGTCGGYRGVGGIGGLPDGPCPECGRWD